MHEADDRGGGEGLNNLEDALQSVILKGDGRKTKGDIAALYGVSGSLPNKSIINSMAAGFIDILYKA